MASRTTTVLGKRKERGEKDLVLQLASSPEPTVYTVSEPENESVATFDIPVASSSKLRSELEADKRHYRCTFEGCSKAYSKPSRLAEHERSHTGDRPFICSACGKSYLRENHLQAHARSHLPSSARPFVCEEDGCGKRFWTTQHLRAHSDLHRGEKPFRCNELFCEAAFFKHHQLRDHICLVHAPPGTKPYRCDHTGCSKSFGTNQKLRQHTKTHDEQRYTCVHPSCLVTSPAYFGTWSALQHHIRTNHPPTCPFESCKGKTFSAQRNLRAHMKLHEEREVSDALQAHQEDMESGTPLKKRRGGHVGRDFACYIENCSKDFKSKKTLNNHISVNHLGRHNFVCPYETCAKSFGYKHLLQRHLVKLHDAIHEAGPELNSSNEQETRDSQHNIAAKNIPPATGIDTITGRGYRARLSDKPGVVCAKLPCPFPNLHNPLPSATHTHSGGNPCEYVFSRGYDLRRHLRAEHGIEVEKEKIDKWVKEKQMEGMASLS